MRSLSGSRAWPTAAGAAVLALAAVAQPAAADAAPSPTPPSASGGIVRVSVPDAAAAARLAGLALDRTEASGPGWTDVLLHGPADAARLRGAGLSWTARTPGAAPKAAGTLPSGRTSYRTLADYESEMSALARRHPDRVRRLTLPHRTVEGRRVHGMEIGHRVGARDGRPVFLMVGLHHAREWPSGEMTMEFGYDLLRGDGRDREITRLLDRARVVIVPVVNPDGFDASRSRANEDKRKNCRVVDGEPAPPPLCTRPGSAELGVDVNRNYGFGWGGTGSGDDRTAGDYRGAGPFSEPESRNVRDLVASRQVTTLITNHTYGGTILRPYFSKAEGTTPDEAAYKALSDAMSAQNGYKGMRSGDDYETTGETNDWSYYATRGLGYTFEFGRETFHPDFASLPGEYNGAGPYAGKGARGAFLLALRNAASRDAHSVIRGRAPSGATLKITKSFTLWTSPVGGRARPVPTRLSSTMVVPRGGRFAWDVNPSVRPKSPFTADGVRPVTGLVRERWTLTCTPRHGRGGTTVRVLVDRGREAAVDLRRCR
ncbi:MULTISPECIES: zinc carboxypeptidase [Actinomadura]|uniref:M14 family zinc carboxypeptidase n=1 Tax=Actinomadura yumaensis TaxID=111807 RepID=A0ABW2CXP3_9ACTN|nr:zinc carboxypeptidase [Actinomadura sp. J1-007]MWK33237.1 peptidase M14 [Actinomadura sp. J1-007]